MPNEDNMLWIIGLDLSLTSTGVYTTDIHGEALGGVIKPNKLRGIPRHNYILNDLAQVEIESGREGKPDLVVIEGYAMGRAGNIGRVFDIGELGGIVKLTYYNRSIPMLIVPPKTLKMFAVDNGNADKQAMVEWAKTNGYDPKTDDDADAFALHSLGSAYLRGRARSSRRKQVFEGCTLINQTN